MKSERRCLVSALWQEFIWSVGSLCPSWKSDSPNNCPDNHDNVMSCPCHDLWGFTKMPKGQFAAQDDNLDDVPDMWARMKTTPAPSATMVRVPKCLSFDAASKSEWTEAILWCPLWKLRSFNLQTCCRWLQYILFCWKACQACLQTRQAVGPSRKLQIQPGDLVLRCVKCLLRSPAAQASRLKIGMFGELDSTEKLCQASRSSWKMLHHRGKMSRI